MVAAFIAAIIFLLGSHKQKGDKAATEDLEIEDRPIHVGRWKWNIDDSFEE